MDLIETGARQSQTDTDNMSTHEQTAMYNWEYQERNCRETSEVDTYAIFYRHVTGMAVIFVTSTIGGKYLTQCCRESAGNSERGCYNKSHANAGHLW